jgi:C1A family cysteine protease
MGALVLFGSPPEEHWPYVESDYDKEPPAFCYAFAQSYKTISYYRLDPPLIPREELLSKIKTSLVANIPAMFGFTVYSSINQASSTGKIPCPVSHETILGGHAVVAVGFDDNMTITNTNPEGIKTKGALLIRNSWGLGWGNKGYGWLPYEYVIKNLAVDWWSLIKMDWVNTGIFTI